MKLEVLEDEGEVDLKKQNETALIMRLKHERVINLLKNNKTNKTGGISTK